MVIIKQETAIIGKKAGTFHRHNTRIKKYHVSRKGTARLNKWWDFYMRQPDSQPSKRKKFDLEVERVIE